jgi:hypothetical protein
MVFRRLVQDVFSASPPSMERLLGGTPQRYRPGSPPQHKVVLRVQGRGLVDLRRSHFRAESKLSTCILPLAVLIEWRGGQGGLR